MAFSAGTVTSSFVWKMNVGGVSLVTDSSPDKLFASSGSGFVNPAVPASLSLAEPQAMIEKADATGLFVTGLPA